MQRQNFGNQIKKTLHDSTFQRVIVAVNLLMWLFMTGFWIADPANGHGGVEVVGLLAGLTLLFMLIPMNIKLKLPKRKKKAKPQRPVTDEQYNANRHQDQRRVDTILDKISKRGYESLTKEEKAFLFNYK